MSNSNSKIEIPLFTLNYVNRLYKNIEHSDAFDTYKQKEFEYEGEFTIGRSGIFINKDFYLDSSLSIEINAINLYENLRLNETEASDKRLWTYLTHVSFWNYMIEEWKIDFTKDKGQIINYIRDRYFLNTLNIRSLNHNGISRLWWYTHLTIDESRQDKYELTKVMLRIGYGNVSEFDLATGFTNYYGEPSFTSYTPGDGTNSDLHLSAADTNAIDQGVDMSLYFNTDKNSVSRPQGSGWDIGAYEYTAGTNIITTLTENKEILQIYPNPFSNSATIEYTLPEGSDVEIVLYDLTGRKIENLYSGYQSSGIHTLSINVNDLNPGIYFYKMKTGKYEVIRKCIKIK